MFGLSPTELVVIGVIVLLIFGAKRLPEIGKGIGGAIKEFRDVKKDLVSDDASPKKAETQKEASASFESKVMDKVLDQVPGVKQVKEVKDKAEKVKELFG